MAVDELGEVRDQEQHPASDVIGLAGEADRVGGDPSLWAETAQLTGLDTAAGDCFAASIAVSGDLIAIGAPFYSGSGAVYLFERDAGGPGLWGQVATFVPDDAVAGALVS